MIRNYYFYCLIIAVASITSCKKYLTLDLPSTALGDKAVFNDSATAEAAILGMYHRCMQNSLAIYNGGGTLLTGLITDELEITSVDPFYQEIYDYSQQPTNTLIQNVWTELYQLIYRANAAIEGLSTHALGSRPIYERLAGEAYFIRALAYLELIQLFGPVPLTLTTDYRVNSILKRTEEEQVMQHIVKDLQQATSLLPTSYFAKNGRVRPNRFAALAMLSRIFLYRKEWSEAIMAADNVLSEKTLFSLAEHPKQVFEPTSREAIWQLMPVLPGYNTGVSQLFLIGAGIPTYATLHSNFLEAFEIGDTRLEEWIALHNFSGRNYYQPQKYRFRTAGEGKEFLVMLRLGEVILNRAEARAETGDFDGATEDLNQIRKRAGLSALSFLTKADLLQAISNERRIELAFEGTHRWSDLKRTGRAEEVLSALKSDSWRSEALYWPIPQTEINGNPNLNQNKGY